MGLLKRAVRNVSSVLYLRRELRLNEKNQYRHVLIAPRLRLSLDCQRIFQEEGKSTMLFSCHRKTRAEKFLFSSRNIESAAKLYSRHMLYNEIHIKHKGPFRTCEIPRRNYLRVCYLKTKKKRSYSNKPGLILKLGTSICKMRRSFLLDIAINCRIGKNEIRLTASRQSLDNKGKSGFSNNVTKVCILRRNEENLKRLDRLVNVNESKLVTPERFSRKGVHQAQTNMTMLQAITWENGKLEILDQILLPAISRYIPVRGVEDGWKVINNMQVRGAPAIAIVGCLSLAIEIKKEEYTDKKSLRQDVEGKLNYLASARPTAVNMKIAADELIQLANKLTKDDTVNVTEMKERFFEAIEAMLEKDIADNKAIGDFGAQEILKNVSGDHSVRILTHCNTGSLATAGYGTALGVIRSLHKKNSLEHAYCSETRPYNQGARLTAYELVYEKIPATLICDDMVAALMKSRNISAVVVGADRVAANGDTANKIGTYQVIFATKCLRWNLGSVYWIPNQIAIVAKYHNVPFYVAAPRTSIDFSIPNGDHIVIEERPEREMTHINDQRIAAPGIQCWNPAFDVTPASLIKGIITEVGVYRPEDLIQLKNYCEQRRKLPGCIYTNELTADTENTGMDATDVLDPDTPSTKGEHVSNAGNNNGNNNEDDEAPTVEETYEVTTTKRKTIRTSYKIQETKDLVVDQIVYITHNNNDNIDISHEVKMETIEKVQQALENEWYLLCTFDNSIMKAPQLDL
ncbi:Methylthioribose-1-phosphate isomerase [Melipona quadrifasciata]|uniref:Methylthioribose-1-phosphate isomerase n=1 Tax=Melipona quadrifasciata TaxID=166423 RepID=A0A0M8ZVG9_9HYME|nr:Methylthioribose-1-phosphate isomerase [Melipona quadrifasciata]